MQTYGIAREGNFPGDVIIYARFRQNPAVYTYKRAPLFTDMYFESSLIIKNNKNLLTFKIM